MSQQHNTDHLARFQALLGEIFQFDFADLDTGIYRLFRLREHELRQFIEQTLPAEVDAAFGADTSEQKRQIQEKIDELAARIREDLSDDALDANGSLAETYHKTKLGKEYLKAREALDGITSNESERDEVFNHLYTFFARYYEDADFIPKRRYSRRPDTYAVPYSGEEVIFHWATRGMHYIKTGEHFRDYRFKVQTMEGDCYVHFKLTDADIPKDNTKGDRRWFFPLPESVAWDEEVSTLTVPFHYRLPTEQEAAEHGTNSKAQHSVLATMEKDILGKAGDAAPLLQAKLEEKTQDGETSYLLRRMAHFARRHSTDYFIYPDLKPFLERELEFYLKDQMLHLDDLEGDLNARLRLLRVVRDIAHRIISFLDDIEQLQNRLFEKPKFVLSTDWLLHIRHVPSALWNEILDNENQIAAWQHLFSTPAKVDEHFLKTHPTLVLDTRHFDAGFKRRLLEQLPFDSIEEATDGLLIHSENWQALNLLQYKYAGKVACIYIDPPYNTGSDEFIYKDRYQHASWMSMMEDRVFHGRTLLKDSGVMFASIDENEQTRLETVLRNVFGNQNQVEELIWVQNTTHSQSPAYSTNHEYIKVFARQFESAIRDPLTFREPKPGYLEISELIKNLNSNYPPIKDVEKAIRALMEQHIQEFKKELNDSGLSYNEETKKIDPWRGIYNYRNAEYRDSEGRLVSHKEANKRKAQIWVWREDNPSAPAQKQSATTRDPEHRNFRFYKPLHPITRKRSPHPKSGWRWPYTWPESDRDTFVRLDADDRIVWGADENKIPQQKRFLHEVETNVSKSVFHEYTDGEKQLTNIFGETAFFSNPKPTTLVERFINQTCRGSEIVLDYFAGSGTTGHSVIDINRREGSGHRLLLVENGQHFERILLSRIEKLMYNPTWKNGEAIEEPIFDDLFSQSALPDWVQRSPRLIKVLNIESYDDSLQNLVDHEFGRRNSNGPQTDLRYLFEKAGTGAATLLNVERLERPFEYTLEVVGEDGPQAKPVDLVETANLLLGLNVVKYETWTAPEGREYLAVRAEKDGRHWLVLWRNMNDLDIEAERRFLEPAIDGYDEVRINGDSAVPGIRSIDLDLARAMGAA